jgi:geranylgeranyl reductase family protein
MSTAYDVAIVGAGPAGAWAAFRLASGGARVAVLDPSHPREKPCGGGLTGRALARVAAAVDPATLASVHISGARFMHRERTALVDLAAGGASATPLVVSGRKSFDAALLASAVRAGARHLPHRVTGLRRTAARWTIDTRDGSCEAEWLIGADGANSFVRRTVARPFARADLSIAAGFFVHGRSAGEIDVVFEEEPPGYLWSFPRPDHLAVGVCAQADESTPAVLLAQARAWIDRYAPGGTLERYGWPIPSLTERALTGEHPAGDGWMLAGDAAGLVDAITREGIYFALESADFAADALLAGRNPPSAYAARVRREIHSELIRAARLKAHFFQPRFMGLLLKGLERSAGIRLVMADLVSGRQTYAGLRRRLLKTLEWKLMLELFGY